MRSSRAPRSRPANGSSRSTQARIDRRARGRAAPAGARPRTRSRTCGRRGAPRRPERGQPRPPLGRRRRSVCHHGSRARVGGRHDDVGRPTAPAAAGRPWRRSRRRRGGDAGARRPVPARRRGPRPHRRRDAATATRSGPAIVLPLPFGPSRTQRSASRHAASRCRRGWPGRRARAARPRAAGRSSVTERRSGRAGGAGPRSRGRSRRHRRRRRPGRPAVAGTDIDEASSRKSTRGSRSMPTNRPVVADTPPMPRR